MPQIKSEEKKKLKKNLKVANKLLKHAKIPVTATAKYNIPVSREVDIINKWKTLVLADKELSQMRRKYQEGILTELLLGTSVKIITTVE